MGWWEGGGHSTNHLYTFLSVEHLAFNKKGKDYNLIFLPEPTAINIFIYIFLDLSMHILHQWDNVYIILHALFSVNYSSNYSGQCARAIRTDVHICNTKITKKYSLLSLSLSPHLKSPKLTGRYVWPPVMQTNRRNLGEFLLFCFKNEIGV